MTAGELMEALKHIPAELEITVRCEYEGLEPNGPCFELRGVSIEDDHNSGASFVAFDCGQESAAQPFMRRVVERERLCGLDGTEEVTLQCGHVVTRVVPDQALHIYCAECVNDLIAQQKAIEKRKALRQGASGPAIALSPDTERKDPV